MEQVVLTIHLILAICLIVVVLLQRSEGGALGIGGGGGGGLVSGRSAATALSKVTWGLAIAFIATSLGLTVLSVQNRGASSVIGVEEGAPAPAGLESDDLGFTPSLPSFDDGPATPPSDAPLTPPPAQ